MDASLVERLAELVQLNANAKRVYGDPVERDGTTIIPVARMQWGFGGGGMGQGHTERGGGGGGVRATPVGYIEIRGGSSRFRPIMDLSGAAAMAAAALGGLVAGFLIFRARR